ncbi:MAG: Omp28-related outer membrane protein [Alistipes sp.]|nr:Omp28-related outer membrane protein [Alistipes sp.]
MKITKFLALFGAVAAFAACEPTPGLGPEPSTEGKITLSADKTTIALGESVTFKAEQKDEATGEMVDITAFVQIYDSELNSVSNPFTPTASGYYTFNCTYGADASNNLTITVLAKMPEVPSDPDPSCLAFNHRVVLVDHTGANCPYCPQMTDKLIQLASTSYHNNYNEVTCHGNGGNLTQGDPANSNAAEMLGQYYSSIFGQFGMPTVCINFTGAKIVNSAAALNNIKAALDNNVKKDGADVGIAMALEGDATNVYCAAQVKAKVAQEYKAVAWLLESNIYNKSQAGAQNDTHRIYNYAIRNISGKYSASNVSGESVGVIEAGKTLDCAFQLPIISTKWNYENMGVLVIVSAKNANGRWEVVNSAYCSLADKSKTYEYLN